MPGETNNLNDKVTEQLVARNEDLQNENTVMKGLLKELDSKVSKFESMDLEGVEEVLEKYESLGTPEALKDALNQLDALAKKSESDDCENDDDDDDDEKEEKETEEESEVNKENEDGAGTENEPVAEPKESTSEEDELSKQLDDEEKDEEEETNKSEGNDKMSKELEEKVAKLESDLATAKDLNAKYESLGGSPEEIGNLLDEVNSSLEQFNKMGSKEEILSKLESYDAVCGENKDLTAKVESFEAIGTVEQVSEMFEELKNAKLESAADDLSKELDISKEQALLSINKFESVDEARDFLTQVLPSKAGAGKVVTGDEAKHESEEESVVTDEAEKEEEKAEAKHESASAVSQYSTLKNLLKKL